MISRVILLTSAAEAAVLGPFLSPLLTAHNPTGRVISATDLSDLEAAADGSLGTRLIAFCTAVIVPPPILARIDCAAYNLHPGPPSYPGRYPESFASYDGVARFGATLHQMAPRVDEGPIVAVEWFDVKPGAGQRVLGEQVYRAAIELLARYGPALAADPALPIDPDLAWSGRKTTRADHEAMRRLPPDIDAVEFERRRRAFADVPGARLTVSLHGHAFHWDAPPEDATITG
jgi:methionyl-tRNA formyltransferase